MAKPEDNSEENVDSDDEDLEALRKQVEVKERKISKDRDGRHNRRYYKNIEESLGKLNVYGSLAKAAVFSFLILLASLAVPYFNIPFFGENVQKFSGYISNIFIVFIYSIFLVCAYLAKKTLESEIIKGDSTEAEITRIIDKYSGIVDGMGTALPLIGAAFLLYTAGVGKENKDLFLNSAIPFEIRSILVLAMAKLFNSVFDELALKYQAIVEEAKIPEDLTPTFPNENQLREIRELMEHNKQLGDDIQNIYINILREVQITSKGFQDPNVADSLNSLVKLTRK